MPKKIIVIKSSGQEEPFSEKKYRSSLFRAGASDEIIDEVIKEMQQTIKTKVTTKELYKEAMKILKKKEKSSAGRYHLKYALFELGPSGYPFERFIGDLFEEYGYRVEVSKLIQGFCVTHEVDIIAQKDNKTLLIECKFHNAPGLYCSVKTSLYVNSRFDDIREYAIKNKSKGVPFDEGYLVTNTRFSSDAIAFAECRGVKLIGWHHPKNDGLSRMIDEKGLHPITCVTSLKKAEIRKLILQGIVTCRDLCKNQQSLKDLRLGKERFDEVLKEAGGICKIGD